MRYLSAAQTAVNVLAGGSIPSAVFGMCLARGQNVAGAPVVIRRCARRHATQRWAIAAGTIYQAGLCLAAGAGDGRSPVIVTACTGGASQTWTDSGGQLRNGQNGECVDDPAASRTPGTALDLAACTGTRRRTWWLP